MALLSPNTAVAQGQIVISPPPASAPSGHPLKVNLGAPGHPIHALPTPERFKAVRDIGYLNNGGTPPLLYHGGPVMHSPKIYAIFWIPPHLQDGHATSLSSGYQKIQVNMLKEYFGHSLMNNNTQYYDSQWIKNAGTFAGSYVDKSLYPGSDCFDPSGELTNGFNCVSDADLQNEVNKVMGIKGWTGGVNKMFMVFTSSDEGQCAGSSCSYAQYCAYHSYYINGASQYVIYGNEPYGDLNVCQLPGEPSPNGDPAADTAATAASHELTESITDPLLNAWYDSSGYEIGDECAYFYLYNGWDGGLANEQWDGFPFLLQTEYSNILQLWDASGGTYPGCFNAGPDL
jgi:hypothetical protein